MPDVSFTSVYVDAAANIDAVRAAVAQLPSPPGVIKVLVDNRSMTNTFGCRIAIDLTGTFDEAEEGPSISRQYAHRLSGLLGLPAFALRDLLQADPTEFLF